MNWCNPGRSKNLLLIRNVDDVLDYALQFQPNSVGLDEMHVPVYAREYDSLLRWLENRMRYAWHPNAKSYTYVYSYRARDDIEEGSDQAKQFVECMLASSLGRRNDWIASCDLVKVGTAIDPEKRRRAHLRELYGQFPGLKGALVFNRCLLMLPCFRANAGDYLESLVLSSMPDEDHFSGEWYHDTIGVARTLSTLFVASRVCYLRDEHKYGKHALLECRQ